MDSIYFLTVATSFLIISKTAGRKCSACGRFLHCISADQPRAASQEIVPGIDSVSFARQNRQSNTFSRRSGNLSVDLSLR